MSIDPLVKDASGPIAKGFNLLWDGYGLGAGASGIFNYGYNLGSELAKLGVLPKVLSPASRALKLVEDFSYVDFINYGKFNFIMESKLVWQWRVGRYLIKNRHLLGENPLLHGLSNFNLPWADKVYKNYKTIVTIHDLIPFISRENVSPTYFFQLEQSLKRIIPRVHRIIVVSHWTRRHLEEFFPEVDKSKIVVISHGVPEFRPKTIIPRNSEITRLLYVSRWERYKRFDQLVEIVRRAKGLYEATIVTDHLGRKWLNDSCRELIKKQWIIVKTGLSQAGLDKEYNAADVYVHPSLFEGFGLPPVEALARGLPVVYQSGNALEEVIGDTLGFPLQLGEPIDNWIDTINETRRISLTEEFQTKLKSIIKTKSTWRDSARSHLQLYNQLSINT